MYPHPLDWSLSAIRFRTAKPCTKLILSLSPRNSKEEPGIILCSSGLIRAPLFIYIYTYIFFVKVSLQEYSKIVNLQKSKFSTCFLFCVYFFKKISQAANLHFKSPKKTLKSIVHDRYSCSNTPSCLFFETLFTMKN